MLSFYLLTLIASAVYGLDPLVKTNVGLIKGLRSSDGAYSMFMGIPYADVDFSNPFGLSTPHPPFEDTFEAFDDSAICPQIDEFSLNYIGTLDCLHLNIYVPDSASSNNKLPVLVFIHGGGYENGYSGRRFFDPKFLVRHDIIVVTLNYRVGPYGFFCLNTERVPGNQGLKDQLLALRWINENINAFGGDDAKITAYGESMGARSIDMHVYSEHEKLFNQIILSSESAMSPWGLIDADREAPMKLAEYLGFVTTDVDAAIDFLSELDPALVIGAVDDFKTVYRLCKEQYEDKFIVDYPVNINSLPKIRNMPILMGFNSDEWIAFIDNPAQDIIKQFLNESFDFDEATLNEMEKIVKHYYVGDNVIDESETFRNFGSDFQFNYPMIRSIPKYIENGADNIYLYLFSYVGGRNFVRQARSWSQTGGASHADELGYLFNMDFLKDSLKDEDMLIVDRITTIWANFVKYGNPVPESTDLLPVTWSPLTAQNYHYVNIDKELIASGRPFTSRMTFWDLFYKINLSKIKGYSS